MLEAKRTSTDTFSTEDDENRLRDLIYKYYRLGIAKELIEEAKQLQRDLIRSADDINFNQQIQEKEKEESQKQQKQEALVTVRKRKKRQSAMDALKDNVYTELMEDEVIPLKKNKSRSSKKKYTNLQD